MAELFEDAVAVYDLGDCATALRLFEPLAGQNYAEVQFSFGFMYCNGRGVQQDHAEAAKWCRLAADHGYAEA